MRHTLGVFLDLLWTGGAIAVCVGMYWFAYRMEPHWVSKDRSRFLTIAQPIDRYGIAQGRKREVRVALMPGGEVLVSRRSIGRSNAERWRIAAKSPQPPKGKQIYLMRPVVQDPEGAMLLLRLPASSKVISALDEHAPVVGPDDSATSIIARGSGRAGRRADRG